MAAEVAWLGNMPPGSNSPPVSWRWSPSPPRIVSIGRPATTSIQTEHSAQHLTRARILLKADATEVGVGWSDSRIFGGPRYKRPHRTSGNLSRTVSKRSWPASPIRNRLGRGYSMARRKPSWPRWRAGRCWRAMPNEAWVCWNRKSWSCISLQAQATTRSAARSKKYSPAASQATMDESRRRPAAFVADVEDILEAYQRPRDRELCRLSGWNLEAVVRRDAYADPVKPGKPLRLSRIAGSLSRPRLW